MLFVQNPMLTYNHLTMDKAQLLAALEQAYKSKKLTDLGVLSEKAVTEYSNEAFGHYYKGEYYLSLNDADAALPCLKKAVDLSPNFENQMALAIAKLQLNDDGEAKVIFDKLLTINNKSADLYYSIALYHLGASDDEATLAQLNKAIEINPLHINALDLRAYVHKNLDNDEEALADLNTLLQVNPNEIPWRFQRIELLKESEDREGIEKDFQFLIENHSDDIEFRINFGDYYLEIGELQEAVYCYSDAVDIEKRSGSSTAFPYKKRAIALQRRGDFYKAIEDYKLVMKLDDEDPDSYLGLADSYYALQKPEQALNYLEIGLDVVFDARWRLHQKQGELAMELKRYDEAETAFKGMTKEVLGRGEGYFQLGLLYLRQGDLQLAYNALKEAEENLHDKAEDMIQQHCQKFIKTDGRLQERELQAEYEDEIANNANSATLKTAFGKLWKLDEKTTVDKNALLGQLPAEMKTQILEAFKGMLVKISARGFLIFNLDQEDTRAVYSINSESGETVTVEVFPFGRSSTNEMTFKVSDKHFTLCGVGSGKSTLDLYFVPCNMTELSATIQKNFKEKEADGGMDFLK